MKKTITFIAMVGVFVSSAIAQPVQSPSPLVGESWTYRKVDMWTSKPVREVRSTLTGTLGEFGRVNYETRDAPVAGGDLPIEPVLSTATIRLNLNGANNVAGQVYPVEWYSWPLEVGKKWTMVYKSRDDSPSRPARIYSYQIDCEVVGWETVETEASTFKTLKITRRSKSILESTGELFTSTQTGWYAPDAHRDVKFMYESFSATGAPLLRTIETLIRHSLSSDRPSSGVSTDCLKCMNKTRASIL